MINFVKGLFRADKNGNKISIAAWLSFLYFASLPISIVPLPIEMSALKLVSFAVGGGLLICLIVGDNTLEFNIVHLFIMLYLTYTILCMLMLADADAWKTLRAMVETCIIFMLITTRSYNIRERNLMYNAWIIVGIIATVAMFTSSGTVDDGDRVSIVLGGNQQDPNELCGLYVMPLLICADGLISKHRKWIEKVLFVILAGGIIYAVFLTGSRGGMVAVFMPVMIYIFWAVKGYKNKIKMIAIVILAIIFVYLFIFPLLPESITDRLSVEAVEQDKGSGRFEIWQMVWVGISQSYKSMIFGNGLCSTTQFAVYNGKHLVAHNHWLQIWCDQGLTGLTLFLLVMLSGTFRNMKTDKIIAVSMAGMFVLSMSLTLYAYYKLFWNIIMMTAMNFPNIKKNHSILED